MALTQFSDVFASFHEKGFNNIVTALQRQRPSLFNYGTQGYVSNPSLLCYKIFPQKIDPEVLTHPDPVVKLQQPIAIPGYDGPYGLQYCFQLAELSIDLAPNNIHNLPPEIKSLFADQCFSLKARVCGQINCPGSDILNRITPDLPAYAPDLPGSKTADNPSDYTKGRYPGRNPNNDPAYNPSSDQPKTLVPLIPLPLNKESDNCFCVELYAVCRLTREGSNADPVVALYLAGLELVDIKPDGLESSLECFLKTTLTLGVFPKIKIAMNALVLRLKHFLTIEPTPISVNVPHNPSIDNDQLKVFVTLTA